ncbi:MAG: response regulator [Elusimicrobiota bacterium]
MREKIRVLIIEDDLDVMEFVKFALASFEIATEVSYARNGLSVGFEVAKSAPELIVLDLMLPDSDGFEICKNLRLNPGLQTAKIIAITGFDTPENREKILNCGADDYLAKPFELTQFRDMLRKHLC